MTRQRRNKTVSIAQSSTHPVGARRTLLGGSVPHRNQI